MLLGGRLCSNKHSDDVDPGLFHISKLAALAGPEELVAFNRDLRGTISSRSYGLFTPLVTVWTPFYVEGFADSIGQDIRSYRKATSWRYIPRLRVLSFSVAGPQVTEFLKQANPEFVAQLHWRFGEFNWEDFDLVYSYVSQL